MIVSIPGARELAERYDPTLPQEGLPLAALRLEEAGTSADSVGTLYDSDGEVVVLEQIFLVPGGGEPGCNLHEGGGRRRIPACLVSGAGSVTTL